MSEDKKETLLEQLKTQEVVAPEIRQLLVARYSLLHLYSDFNIENTLPTIEQIRAVHTNPSLLEEVEQPFIRFINFLREKAEKMDDEEARKELLFPAEEVLTWLIKKVGGKPIYDEVSNDK